MFTILDYSSALEYSIIRRYTNIVYYYYYKSRVKKDASLNVYADCGETPYDVNHLFALPNHPTTLIPSDLWSRTMDYIQELSYLEKGNPD